MTAPGRPTDGQMKNPVDMSGMSTERMAGVLVIGALIFLIAVRRGFRAIDVSDATGGLVRP